MNDTAPVSLSRTMPQAEDRETRIELFDGGYVQLVGTTFDFSDTIEYRDSWSIDRNNYTLDEAVVRAARVSYQGGTTTTRDNEQLIDYLMRKRHTSPFEQVELKFVIKAPLFVVQQLLRHRTANVNQESARYSIMADEAYYPESFRSQASTNRQGSGDDLDPVKQELADRAYTVGIESGLGAYQRLLDSGVSREQARGVLPHATYTTLVWKVDLHNLLHFLKLRMDPHAQEETRQYAIAIYSLAYPYAPLTFAAWHHHVLDAVTFSSDELHVLKELLHQGIPRSVADAREVVDKALADSMLRGSRKLELRDKLAWVLMTDLSDE
jgi:thymidylate synthase (FAD)